MPPAGSVTVDVTGQVSITGRTGQETVALTGTATVQLAAPHVKGSVEANNATLTALSLSGNSVTGPVTVAKSASPASTGELRAISGNLFPAASFFDVYADVTVPAAPNPSITLHNNTPLHFTNGNLQSWPPNNVMYSASPNPCILLQPSIQNPAQICITSASMTLDVAGVGGTSQLTSVKQDTARVEETTFNDHAVGTLIVLALVGTFGIVANYARARFRSDD
jgi:hypothetical protein